MDTQIIDFSIPKKLLQNIDRVAKATSRSRSEMIREAVRRILEEQEAKDLLFNSIRASSKKANLSEKRAAEIAEEAKKWARKNSK
ncbi:ribbon-helix-helix protein, CopG family [Candidatus Gottesmanbacteria bacterium]|nr:ribbon-helix-helix protein, CopG family [Candidatus Gottesmanbacteria bacterium]